MSQITTDKLMAYLDGQLDAAEAAEVEANLAANPDAAADLAALRRQSDAIRVLYAPAAAEPVPARLDPHRLALLAGRKSRQRLAQAAMIVCLIGIGIAAGMLLRPNTYSPALYDRLIADAVSAHTVYVAENRHAVEVPGEDADHLSTWLSNRLATQLAMPDLSAQGLTLLGGRLLPAPAIPGGRAAQLMYEDQTGERVTLYITPAAGVDGPSEETVAFGPDTNALYWADAFVTCTIVANLPPEALQAVAATIFRELSPDPTYEL